METIDSLYNLQLGTGIILVHKYPESTGLCTVLPTNVLGIEEGFYPLIVTRDLYTGNIKLTIDQDKGIDYDEMETIVGSRIKGAGVGNIMTQPIWGFKKR